MEGIEERILEAAIACIEEFGVHRLTVRRIAAKAGVNTAAINYYFRTKEQLKDRVDELTIRNAFDWSDLQGTEALPPREQLLAIMEHLTEGALNFPQVTRAHFFESMMNGNYESRAVRELNRFMETLLFKFREKGCRMEEKALRFSISQVFMAGLFSLGVVPNLCRDFLGADLTDAGARRAYLQHLVDRLIDS
jgi:AcrR family transcriptional regulator